LTKEEKIRIKLRYAAALHKALKASPLVSFRKLAKEAGMEPAHIQKISVGKLDVSLTTCIAIANALGLSYTELLAIYDHITEEDIDLFAAYLTRQRKITGTKSK
jgi:DNA-binding XRE family transcriptional regulator